MSISIYGNTRFLIVRSGFLLRFISFYKMYQASDQLSHLFSISANMRDR